MKEELFVFFFLLQRRRSDWCSKKLVISHDVTKKIIFERKTKKSKQKKAASKPFELCSNDKLKQSIRSKSNKQGKYNKNNKRNSISKEIQGIKCLHKRKNGEIQNESFEITKYRCINGCEFKREQMSALNFNENNNSNNKIMSKKI